MKKILIIDESIFSRICSALLELEGYKTKIFKSVKNLPKKFDYKKFELKRLLQKSSFCHPELVSGSHDPELDSGLILLDAEIP